MLSSVMMIAMVLAGQLDATVTPLSGEPIAGELIQLDSSGATLKVNGEERKFTSQDFRNIDLAPATDAPPLPIHVELTDGSNLRCAKYTVSNSSASLVLADEQTLSVPTKSIRRVLLQELITDDDKTLWEELSLEQVGKDILVFKRDVAGARLDSYDGVLRDINDETVVLTFMGDDLKASRKRVIGISYFHPEGSAPTARSVCNIVDLSGSTWRAASMELKDGALQWATPTGLQMTMPTTGLRQLDYAVGNLVYLSDLQPEAQTWEPYIESRVGRELLAPRYAPRQNESFDGGPLLLQGTAYSKGLGLHSRTELVYRLKDPYNRFRAQVGLDDRVRDAEIQASVRLVISGDDKVLFDQIVSVSSGAVDLDLDITGVKRLRVLVDFGDDLDVADYLNLCEARLTK